MGDDGGGGTGAPLKFARTHSKILESKLGYVPDPYERVHNFGRGRVPSFNSESLETAWSAPQKWAPAQVPQCAAPFLEKFAHAIAAL